MVRILAPNDDVLTKAAAVLLDGGLVAFPTETVYGLGANAHDGVAVARIFAAKGRPSFNPLISHGDSLDMLRAEAVFDDRALSLADKFWPGPLTMILPRAVTGKICDLVCAGLPTVALRVPNHPVALALIAAAGVPIAAPSANASGGLSPTSPRDVVESLGENIEMIIAGGATQYGLESTVVDLSGPDTVIVRPGAVTAEDIADVLGCVVTYDLDAKEKPRSPGQLLRHYAPRTPVRLRAVDVAAGEALLAFGSTKFMGVRGGGRVDDMAEDSLRNLSDKGDLLEAAANLFAYLRALDNGTHSAIAVMDIPNIGIGIAINDRLKRAADSQ
ncbi:MAG: L-threonylcarbamoyladenylate synthase [Pseudomonadota bacterium]